jgi:hypothetical protein
VRGVFHGEVPQRETSGQFSLFRLSRIRPVKRNAWRYRLVSSNKGPCSTLLRRQHGNRRIDQLPNSAADETLRLAREHHRPPVAHRADLIGEQVRRNVIAYHSLRLSVFEQTRKLAAELRIAFLDNRGQRRIGGRTNQELKSNQPGRRRPCWQLSIESCDRGLRGYRPKTDRSTIRRIHRTALP